MQIEDTSVDTHAELRALYKVLLESEDRYHEFKQLLLEYPSYPNGPDEGQTATDIRRELNEKIREWIGGHFSGLTVVQMELWKGIIVEERFNVALAPWREANGY